MADCPLDDDADLIDRPPALDAEALRAANINPTTGLATDYLNHFNEITMLIGMAADMPDMVAEMADWRPASYEEHFRRSGFKARDLAVAAYRAGDPAQRAAFEAVVADLDRAILGVIAQLVGSDPAQYPAIVAEAEIVFQAGLARASGLIHGVDMDTDLFAASSSQDSIEKLMA